MRDFLKNCTYSLFRRAQRIGVNIMPNHFYVPIADVNALAADRDHWARPSLMTGIAIDADAQVRKLRSTVLPYQSEYADNAAYREGIAGRFGPGYGPIEAQALHGYLRHLKPKTVIEVGAGVSTHCMLSAMKDHPAKHICIEPYPSDFLRSIGVELHEQRVETMDPSFFDRLEAGDFLFIDSSHAVRAGGDVLFLYLEVLPRLKPGVHVHIHDVYLPYNYNRTILLTYMQWSETALLQALLVNNSRLSIAFSLSLLHYSKPDALREVFPGYTPQADRNGLVDSMSGDGHFPSSIYLVTG